MKGIISNFRVSRHTMKGNHLIVKPDGVATKEGAVKLVGKHVVWKSPAGKEIKGYVAKEHGRNGFVRVVFERGLPGQSIGDKIEIQ